jgi:hypothetical protein
MSFSVPEVTAQQEFFFALDSTGLVKPTLATSAATNPHRIAANVLQDQSAIAIQTNSVILKIARDIANWSSQATKLQQTITTLEGSIYALRAQVADIPTLEPQIVDLENAIIGLRVSFNRIIDRMRGQNH